MTNDEYNELFNDLSWGCDVCLLYNGWIYKIIAFADTDSDGKYYHGARIELLDNLPSEGDNIHYWGDLLKLRADTGEKLAEKLFNEKFIEGKSPNELKDKIEVWY